MIKSDQEYIELQLGKRYSYKKFNCWHLVMEYLHNVPDYSPEEKENIQQAFIEALAKHKELFEEVSEPCNGDVVIYISSIICHCGLWFDNKVLHNSPQIKQVAMENHREILKRFKQCRYFRFNGVRWQNGINSGIAETL